MGADSKIEWCHHTFNPWWGCTRVSPACDHCYAEALAKRYGHDVWGRDGDRRFFGDKHWDEPRRWNRKASEAGVRERVFCASMADVFEDHEDLPPQRERLWNLIYETPNLDWLLLTKRPENIRRMVPAFWVEPETIFEFTGPVADVYDWPRNVWVGTTVENQRYADLRLKKIATLPAPVRFVSCEPLLGPIDFGDWLDGGVNWVIAGGESGGKARPMDAAWAREIRDQAVGAGVPFLFKQWGEHDAEGRRIGKRNAGRDLDGRTWDEFPTDKESYV